MIEINEEFKKTWVKYNYLFDYDKYLLDNSIRDEIELASNNTYNFPMWFDPDKYKWEKYSKALIVYSYRYFLLWYFPDKIPDNMIKIIFSYEKYEKYKSIWREEYLIYSLMN